MTLILQPRAAAGVSGFYPGTGAANVLSPHPREAYVANPDSNAGIGVDFGAPVACDTFFIGYTSAAAGAVVEIHGDTFAGASTIRHSYRRAPARHGLVVLDAPVVARSFTFLVRQPGAAIGVVAAGLAIRPAGFEYGSGRPITDTTRVDRLRDGSFGIEAGVTAGGWSWTMPLTDEERDRVYALALDAGVGSTILVAEGAGVGPGSNEALHWGLLTRLEPYVRQAPDENSWSMQVQDW